MKREGLDRVLLRDLNGLPLVVGDGRVDMLRLRVVRPTPAL